MTTGRAKMNNKRIHIELFNKIVKTGDEVYYFDDIGNVKKDVVTSEADKIGNHTPVMRLKEAGSYLLSRFISKGETVNYKKIELTGRMKQLQEEATRLSEQAKQEFIVFHDAEAHALRAEFDSARSRAGKLAVEISEMED